MQPCTDRLVVNQQFKHQIEDFKRQLQENKDEKSVTYLKKQINFFEQAIEDNKKKIGND